MQGGGAKLNFKKLEGEGRTAKALTHLWDKLSKDAAYLKQDGDAADDDDAAAAAAEPGSGSGSGPSTPTPKTPASKRGSASKYLPTVLVLISFHTCVWKCLCI